MIEAQEALARASSDKERYDLAKRRADQRVEVTPQQQQYQQQPVQQQQRQQAPQPQVDPKAQGWAEKNTWFGQDEVMTYAAFGIHRKLVEEEGFDPQSDDYYTEIDRRVRSEFPHKFKASTSSGKSQVAPAGSSASRSTKQGRRTVRLSPSQIAIAKRLNVPLEEYAKYVKD
jgi:GH15 family glucan-1,4-alpha-glucosidase